MEYYVYMYLRESDNSPYYIGKGKGNRAYVDHGRIRLPPDKSKIVITKSGLTDDQACDLERQLISQFGRKNIDDNGVLHNLTEGGDGGDTSQSPNYKIAMENRDQVPWNKGVTGYKNKYPKNTKRQPWSEERKRKHSERLKQSYKDNPELIEIRRKQMIDYWK